MNEGAGPSRHFFQNDDNNGDDDDDDNGDDDDNANDNGYQWGEFMDEFVDSADDGELLDLESFQTDDLFTGEGAFFFYGFVFFFVKVINKSFSKLVCWFVLFF